MKEGNTIYTLIFNAADFDDHWSYTFMGSHDLEKLESYKNKLESDSDEIRKRINSFKRERDKKIESLRKRIHESFRAKTANSPLYDEDEYKKLIKEMTDLNIRYESEYTKIRMEFGGGFENLIDDPERQYLEIIELQMLD